MQSEAEAEWIKSRSHQLSPCNAVLVASTDRLRVF